MQEKTPLIILTGPTAVGKSELSIALAKKLNGEIISADSIQIYKDLNIGSAKLKKCDMQGICHYLIDVLDPNEDFNVFMFQKMALAAIDEIYVKGKIPIIVGGTGFYIQALLYQIDFKEEKPSNILEKLETKTSEELYETLKKIDPKSADIIHINNRKRVIRAVEFYLIHGSTISEHNAKESQKESPYNFSYFVLNMERNKLYDRIDYRVDKMIEQGLVNEVENLKDKGIKQTAVSMQGLGYKEIYRYLNNDITLDEAVYEIKRDTRHFAKRQLTWFRREKEVVWIEKEKFDFDNEKIIAFMLDKMKG